LTLLGEEQAALIVGLWVEERGQLANSPHRDYLDVAPYLGFRERQTEDELLAHTRRARSPGEVDVLALVRDQLVDMGAAAEAADS